MNAPRALRSLPLVTLVLLALGGTTLTVRGQVASPFPSIQSQAVVIAHAAAGPSGRPVRRSEVGFTVDGLKLVTYPASGQTAKQTADALSAQLGSIYKGRVTRLGINKYELLVETRVPTLVAMRLTAPYSTDRTQTIKLAATKPQVQRQGFGVELRLDAAVYDRPPIVIPSPRPFPGPIGGPIQLSFSDIDKGAMSRHAPASPDRRLITNQADWADLWKLHQGQNGQTALPAVDFAQESVIAVFMGLKTSGGYGVTITAVERPLNPMVHDVTVELTEKSPAPGAIVTMVLTAPYHIIKVDHAITGAATWDLTKVGGSAPTPITPPVLSPPSLHRPLKIKAVFTVWNATAEPFEVVSGGQRYEFIVRDAKGREQWRWSTGRAFPRLIAQRILNLSSGEWVFAEDLEITDPGNHGLALSVGEYSLEAKLLRDNGPEPGATVSFKVR